MVQFLDRSAIAHYEYEVILPLVVVITTAISFPSLVLNVALTRKGTDLIKLKYGPI
jgi:hypothetical protein